jgi:ABC-2 type transport system ATP-binding protein
MDQAPQSALACRGLTRTYVSRFRRRRFTAVDAVDLEVPAGSAFALVGPNGAGKTTLMLMAIGLMRPTAGEALIGGTDARTPAARRHVGFVPEKFQLPAQLTAREFLRLHGALAGLSRDDTRARTDAVIKAVDLVERIDDRLGTFSKGMQQRVAIAQALIARPRVLVLDEPTSALDPLQRRTLRDTLRRVHGDGVTVVLNSHNLAEVEDICDHVAILEDGRIVSSGALRDMVERTSRVRVRLRGWTDELATSLTTRVKLEAIHHDDDQTHFTASIPDEEAAAWIAHEIVTSGAWLFELTPSGEGLEDLFVRTITGSSVTGAAEPVAAPASEPATPTSEDAS